MWSDCGLFRTSTANKSNNIFLTAPFIRLVKERVMEEVNNNKGSPQKLFNNPGNLNCSLLQWQVRQTVLSDILRINSPFILLNNLELISDF